MMKSECDYSDWLKRSLADHKVHNVRLNAKPDGVWYALVKRHCIEYDGLLTS